MMKDIATATAFALMLLMAGSSLSQAAAPASKIAADQGVAPDLGTANAPAKGMPSDTAPGNSAPVSPGPSDVAPGNTAPGGATPNTAPPVRAENPALQQNEQIAVVPVESVTQFRAKAALGSTVLDSSGTEVGRVEDLVLNQDGQLAAVVVNVGGILGIGGKKVAVAASKARLISDETGKVMELEVSKADLKSAPEFKTQDEIKSDLESRVGKGAQ